MEYAAGRLSSHIAPAEVAFLPQPAQCPTDNLCGGGGDADGAADDHAVPIDVPGSEDVGHARCPESADNHVTTPAPTNLTRMSAQDVPWGSTYASRCLIRGVA